MKILENSVFDPGFDAEIAQLETLSGHVLTSGAAHRRRLAARVNRRICEARSQLSQPEPTLALLLPRKVVRDVDILALGRVSKRLHSQAKALPQYKRAEINAYKRRCRTASWEIWDDQKKLSKRVFEFRDAEDGVGAGVGAGMTMVVGIALFWIYIPEPRPACALGIAAGLITPIVGAMAAYPVIYYWSEGGIKKERAHLIQAKEDALKLFRAAPKSWRREDPEFNSHFLSLRRLEISGLS